MSESVDWTVDTAIRLIEEYRLRPELWNSKHEMFRVPSVKYDAWSELARIFGCDIADLRKKMNSVFASYRREKAKIRNGGRSNWFLYKHLTFLPNHLESPKIGEVVSTANESHVSHSQHERSEQSTEDEEEEDDNNDDNDDGEETAVVIKHEPVTETYYIDETSTTRPVIKAPIRRKELVKRYAPRKTIVKRKVVKDSNLSDSLENRLLETLQSLRKSDLSRKKDECDSFGEYIAISLRKHDERTQSMIKQAINNILFEQEMKKYSTGQYTVMISGMDENPLVLGDADEK